MGSELYSANWQYVGHIQSKHFDQDYAFINMRACIFRTCITELFQKLIESSLSIQFITVQIILTECSLHRKLWHICESSDDRSDISVREGCTKDKFQQSMYTSSRKCKGFEINISGKSVLNKHDPVWALKIYFFHIGTSILYKKKFMSGCVGAPLRWPFVLIGKFLFYVYVLLCGW